MDPPLARAPLAVSRQSRPIFHRPQSAQDWENQRAKIVDLYESNELKDTMKLMEEQHGFKATVNQYKKQLGKWGLDNKCIKDFEYQAMLKKKRKREQEDPLKESAFRLRGAEVDSSKITRYKKRKGVNEDDVASDVGTPSGLSCYTPSLKSCSPVPLSTGRVNAEGGLKLQPTSSSYDRLPVTTFIHNLKGDAHPFTNLDKTPEDVLLQFGSEGLAIRLFCPEMNFCKMTATVRHDRISWLIEEECVSGLSVEAIFDIKDGEKFLRVVDKIETSKIVEDTGFFQLLARRLVEHLEEETSTRGGCELSRRILHWLHWNFFNLLAYRPSLTTSQWTAELRLRSDGGSFLTKCSGDYQRLVHEGE